MSEHIKQLEYFLLGINELHGMYKPYTIAGDIKTMLKDLQTKKDIVEDDLNYWIYKNKDMLKRLDRYVEIAKKNIEVAETYREFLTNG